MKPFGVNIWIGPSIINNKNQNERSVQQFLNDKIRKPLDIPLKHEISDERTFIFPSLVDSLMSISFCSAII